MTTTQPLLAIVLPCYNEASGLPEIVERFIDAASRHGFTPETFRLVLVDNGSTDSTQAVLDGLIEGHSPYKQWVQRHRLEVNQGYGFGLHAGLKVAKAEYVGWTHADGQCSPDDVFKAYRLIAVQAKALCMGRRVGRHLQGWFFSRGYDLAVLLFLRRWMFDINAQPKVFPRSLVAKLNAPPPGFAFDLYVLLKARENGFEILSVPVFFDARRHGSSNWAHGIRSRGRTILAVLRFVRGYSRQALGA